MYDSVSIDVLGPRCEIDLTVFGVNDGGIDDACSDIVDEGRSGAVRSTDVGDSIR